MSWLTEHLFGAKNSNGANVEGVEHEPIDQVVAEGAPAPPTPKETTTTVANATAPTDGTAIDVLSAPTMQLQLDSDNSYEKREIVAEWRVPLRGKLHKIEFEHGTTSGRRVLWIDEKEFFRREWMFKLVGDDSFSLENLHCVLRVDPAPGFSYKYSLFVDGKPFEQFKHCQAKALRIWETSIGDNKYRIVLEKDTLNIFVNGLLREEEGEFVDGGTDTKWEQDGCHFNLSARSGNKREGLVHNLQVNGMKIDEISANETI